jgi:PsbP-like protein
MDLIRIHYTKLSIESLASNICNTEINVNLKTIINMKDRTFPLTYSYFSSLVTVCTVLGILLFVAHLAEMNHTLVFAQEPNETMSLYSNPGVDFEINYPPLWEKREFPAAENSSIIEFLGPSTGVEPRTPSVNVFIFPSGNQSVEQAVNEVIAELEDIQVNSTTMKLDELNVTARVLEYMVTTAHQEFQKLQLWIERPQRTYVITYTNLPDKFSDYLPQFMEMIKTIKIT